MSLLKKVFKCFEDIRAEPVFVDLLRSPRIDSQPGKINSSESIPGLHKHLQMRAQVKAVTDSHIPLSFIRDHCSAMRFLCFIRRNKDILKCYSLLIKSIIYYSIKEMCILIKEF
jgi:hypothetical protein